MTLVKLYPTDPWAFGWKRGAFGARAICFGRWAVIL